MKRQLLLIIIVLTIVAQISFGDAAKFYLAVEGLNVNDVNKLKRELDQMELQSIIMQRGDLKATKKLIKKYKLGQGIEEELQFNIAIANMVEKTKLANRIKELGYQVEENATFLAARKLYLGTLKAKLDLELAQLILDNQLEIFDAEKVKLQNGTISETDYLKSTKQFEQATNDLELAKIEYGKMYDKLRNLLNNDVEIVSEPPRLSTLAPLVYYEQLIDYRFEIQRPKLQNEIIDLDLPFYTKRFFAVPALKRQYEEMLVDQKSYQLDIEQKRYEIKKEIQLARLEIQQATVEVKALATKLADLKARFVQLQALYDKGVISKQKLNDLKVNIKQLENGYYLKACLLNNKRIALGMAVSVGPAYEEE